MIPVALRDSYDLRDISDALGDMKYRIYPGKKKRFKYFREPGYDVEPSIICLLDYKQTNKMMSNFIVTNKKVKSTKTIITTKNPLYAYILIMRHCLNIEKNGFIHASVKVDENADINPTAIIYPGAVVERCHIGAGTVIGAGAYICQDAYIGKNTIIGEGVIIGSDPNVIEQGVRFPAQGSVYIADNVTIGANSVIERGLLKDNVVIIKEIPPLTLISQKNSTIYST